MKSKSIGEITFRPARKSDIAALTALDRLCFPQETAYDSHVFEDILEWHGSWHIVAEKDKKIVGFVAAIPEGRFAHFVTLDIHPEFRRIGLGNELMNMIEKMMINRNIKMAILEVETDNIAAINLYKKCGYQIEGILRNYYENGKDAYVMSKVF